MSVAFTRNQLTPESKNLLRKTVRALRESLIAQLEDSAGQEYLLSVPVAKAPEDLKGARLERRRRLEAALDQAAQEDGGGKEARARAFTAAAKEAGATLLNRLVVIRHLEALGLSKPAVLTGGWMSRGYQEFQQVAAALCEDKTQGMAPLLDLLFAELAVALPGLFGDVGLNSLFRVPPATLRRVIEALDEVPVEAWCDDLTLGWVYQFWNDPDREALDAKLNASGKIEPHEIASKTQMFTERYMVEWLLQNSLGPMWLAICKKRGWAAEAESTGVLAQLDARRAEWRKKREAGAVAPDALMPVNGPLEESWKYYVPQPLPAAVVEHAPESIRDLKVLDPACGSGHFLVVAFDLLVELYREEARHRSESWGDRKIAEWILENNLHGIDIDPRAVQIAAAAVYLKARALAKDVDPRQVNLVAPVLKLSALDTSDVGLLKLEADIQRETGIPPELTRQIIAVLEGVDHLGSLLKLGDAVDKALAAHQGIFATTGRQKELFGGAVPTMPLDKAAAKRRVQDLLKQFLAAHSGAEDLGLRLRGQQLSAGLRFATIAKDGAYDLVVGNPPYLGASKMKDASYIAKNYPMGKSDLYAAFLERGLQLCRAGGTCAMVTMRSWMFLSGFTALRGYLLSTFDLPLLLDLGPGAFEEINAAQVVVSVACTLFRRTPPREGVSLAFRPTAPDDRASAGMTLRKRAAVLTQVGRFDFSPKTLGDVAGRPVLYWWGEDRLRPLRARPLLGSVARVCAGLQTSNDTRFLRRPWEIRSDTLVAALRSRSEPWAPVVAGASGKVWFEPVDDVVRWMHQGLELRVFEKSYLRNVDAYFIGGVAFSDTGNAFTARAHLVPSVIGDKGPSVIAPPEDLDGLLCALNRAESRLFLESLNPGTDFQVGDVARLPVAKVEGASEIVAVLRSAFLAREKAREPSPLFERPGAFSWAAAVEWAQRAVDREPSAPVPEFTPTIESTAPEALLSFQVGVALGHFGLEKKSAQRQGDGAIFLSPRTPANGQGLSLLESEWLRQAPNFVSQSLEEWLRSEFFAYHRKTYELRPVYFPVCSSKRTFVAYVSIQRWTDSTLTRLLSDYLVPERKALEGSLADLRAARASSDKKSRSEMDRQFTEQSKWLEELEDFIAKVTQCAEKGPPPSDASTPAREADAAYVMDLDDGVMVNAAALWPLLDPMWKDPKKWWKELVSAKGRKDYDWSHLAARYFPGRVDEKCQRDRSLAVAHGCLWKYHPEVAYQWELRLQDEIGPEFLIAEKDSDAARKAFHKKDPKRATELQAAEKVRRERKANKQDQDSLALDTSDDSDDEGEAA